jgi:hypothetical protein
MNYDPIISLVVAFVIVTVSLFLLMILQITSSNAERKRLLAEIEDLRNRFMAKDFHDYATGKHILDTHPLTAVDQVEKMLGIDEEEKQRADRLPVS